MSEKELGEAGFRTAFEYYDRMESTYRQMAEEMHQEKMKVLAQWKKTARSREVDDL